MKFIIIILTLLTISDQIFIGLISRLGSNGLEIKTTRDACVSANDCAVMIYAKWDSVRYPSLKYVPVNENKYCDIDVADKLFLINSVIVGTDVCNNILNSTMTNCFSISECFYHSCKIYQDSLVYSIIITPTNITKK